MTADSLVLVPREELLRLAAEIDKVAVGTPQPIPCIHELSNVAVGLRAMIAARPPVDRDALIEAALEGIDNVHDMDVSLRDYATAAVDAILRHLQGSGG